MSYLKALIIFFALLIPLTFISVIFIAPAIIIIYIGLIVIGMIASLGSIILGPILLTLHKSLLGRNLEYGINKRPESLEFTGTLKGFYPALMTCSLALSLCTNTLLIEFFREGPIKDWEVPVGAEPIVVFFMMCLILFPLSILIFASIWVLIDSNIIFTTKNKVKKSRTTPEVINPGTTFKSFLKGYASISIFISLYQFVFIMDQYFYTGTEQEGSLFNNPILLVMFLMPFILLTLTIPVVIFLDVIRKKTTASMLKTANKLGISEELKDPLNIK